MEKQHTLSILRQANDLIRQGECSQALELLDQLDTNTEQGGLICFIRGNAFLQLGEDQQAHLCYGEALNKGFVNKQLYIHFGVVKSRLGNLLQAEMMFRQAADLDPTDALPLNRILLLRLARKDFDGAEAVMDELMQRNPELVDGYHHKADLLLGTGQPEKALELLTKVLDRFSSNPLFLYDLCRTLHRNNRSEQALKLLEEHQDDFHDEKEQVLYKKQKAQLLVDLGRYDDALPLWQDLYNLFGDRQSGMALAANALMKGDMESLYTIACEMLEPNVKDDSHYMCLYYRALCLKQMGDDAAAHEAFVQACVEFDQIEEERTRFQLQSLRATIRTELGRYEDALADLEDLKKKVQNAKDNPQKIEHTLASLEELEQVVRERMNSFV